MLFQVFDNDRPAQNPFVDADESWSNSTFETMKEAQDYAQKWVAFPLPELNLGERFDYSGAGDFIEIRLVEGKEVSDHVR